MIEGLDINNLTAGELLEFIAKNSCKNPGEPFHVILTGATNFPETTITLYVETITTTAALH